MSGADVRVAYLGLDAFDVHVATQLIDRGELPTLAGLLREGASVATESPAGVFVTAQYATMFTGRDPARHGYLCWKHFTPSSYADVENTPRIIDGRPFWDALSDAGRRVALLDVPHTSAPEHFNGTMLIEWGCHDRHFGTQSYPASLADEMTERFGAHPVGTLPPPRPGFDQFAPCDYHHRAGPHRTVDENRALWDDIVEGHARKRAVSLHLLDQGPWDLFMAVFGESHCTGHQLWSVHDTNHPWHSAESVERLGGDPLLEIYRRMDATVGLHLERLGPDTTVYVNLSHGMGPHYDGTHLLDDVLRRLGPSAAGGGLRTGARGLASSAFGAGVRRLGGSTAQSALRRALARPGSPPDDGPDPDPKGGDRHARPWFAIPNNTVSGAIRLNVIGRESRGRLAPGAEVDAACQQLRRWLLELVNVDTGEPVVREVVRTDSVYARSDDDVLPDLFVEWNRNAPIERVWSPRVGLVERKSSHWRTGDHTTDGLLIARGPGITPGRRPGHMPVVDVGVTLAAALGTALPDVDGRPVDFLLPSTTPVAGVALPTSAGSGSGSGAGVGVGVARGSSRRRLPGVLSDRSTRRSSVGQRLSAHAMHLAGRLDMLGDAHHMTRAQADTAVTLAEQAIGALEQQGRRLDLVAQQVERMAAVNAVTAWIRAVDVPESLLVSVVLPTRDRAALVPRAIASVQAQTYGNWELIVVDDGSTDDTPAVLAPYLDDPRIQVHRTEGVTLPCARNLALEAAAGDVVVYLDDDNTFDPLWFKAVVWAFGQRPDVDVLYAARVIDDIHRVERIGAGALPTVHFEPYDRARLERNNIADMGVIAHRAKLPEAHFDTRLTTHADWDLFARLTVDRPPLELPVVALYYVSDSPNRLSDGDLVDLELVRAKFRS